MANNGNPEGNPNFNKGRYFKDGKFTKLTLKQKTAIAEYIKSGKKTAAYKAAYKPSPNHPHQQATAFFKQPKIQNALEKALKGSKFDDVYAVETLKKIVEGGMQNIDITRPDTSLKALETYFKLTNKIGGGNKVAIKLDIEAQAKKMDMTELMNGMKELDKKFKRLKMVMGGKAEEGEVVE